MLPSFSGHRHAAALEAIYARHKLPTVAVEGVGEGTLALNSPQDR